MGQWGMASPWRELWVDMLPLCLGEVKSFGTDLSPVIRDLEPVLELRKDGTLTRLGIEFSLKMG